MEENRKEFPKNKNSNKVAVILLSAIVLVCAAFASVYAFRMFTNPVNEDATKQLLERATNVTDEATLRELLLMDCELDIAVTEDIEISKTLVVNGTKHVTSDSLLKATFQMEDGTPMLDVSKQASLTIDGWNLYGSGVAAGVNVNRYATMEHLSGKMDYMGTYGVTTAGVARLSKDTEISHVGEGAMLVQIEGELYAEGGTYTDGGNYLANVEGGGVLKLSGEPLFDSAVNYLIYNSGETVINGGKFVNSGYRGIANYGNIKMEYIGTDEDGRIEVANTSNVTVYTTSSFKTVLKKVYAHDGGANVLLQANTGGRIYVEDCEFDTSTGNAISVRGTVDFKNVKVSNSGGHGILVQQKAKAEFENIEIDTTKGRGIHVSASSLKVDNVQVSNTTGVGIGSEATEQYGPSKVELSNVSLKDVKGNNVKVAGGSVMNFVNSTFDKSKRNSIFVEDGTVTLKDVKVLGSIDKDTQCVAVQDKGVFEISGNTLITGGVMRGVGVYGGRFVMNGGTIRDIKAQESGAGVHLASGGTFVMKNGTICNNVAEKKNGGGVNVSADSHFIMHNGKIYGNYAAGIAGGVRVDAKGTFELNGGAIYENAAKSSGGGVHVSGNFVMKAGEIYKNTAGSYGGAMNIASITDSKTNEVTAAGKFDMTGGTIYENYSELGGGAIQVSAHTTAKLSGGKIADNDTAGAGDGVRATGLVTVSNSFYMSDDHITPTSKSTVVRIAGNKLEKHSASDPLLLVASSDAVTGTVIAECESKNAATAILGYVASGSRAFELTQVEDTHKIALNYTPFSISMKGADSVYVTNFQELKEAVTSTKTNRYVVVGANIKMESAIKVPDNATVCIRDDGYQRTLSRKEGMTDSFFTTHLGSGLIMQSTDGGLLTLDGKISEEKAEATSKTLINSIGVTQIRGVTLKNNIAESGGAIYATVGSVEITDSKFVNNAAVNGGAVYVKKSVTVSAEDTVFEGNEVRELYKADGTISKKGNCGGAVYDYGQFVAINCEFNNNVAYNTKTPEEGKSVVYGNGGAIYTNDVEAMATLTNVVFSNNQAKDGGAIRINAGTIDAEGCTFADNKAVTEEGGAIMMLADGNGNVSVNLTGNNVFTGNTAKTDGGAIYTGDKQKETILNTATLNIDGAVFGQVRVNSGEPKVYSCGNSSENLGGAIYQASGTVNITNAKFYGNHAKQAGALENMGGTMNVANSDFEGNQANTNGGAIRGDGTTLNITDCNFISNRAGMTANGNGGAIFLSAHVDAVIDATESGKYVFDDNTAVRTGNVMAWGSIASNSDGEVSYSAKYDFKQTNIDGRVNNDKNEDYKLGIGCGLHDKTKKLTRLDEATNYATLQTAMNNAGNYEVTEITLLNDIEMTGTTRLESKTKNIVIQNKAGVDVTIYRTSNVSNVFYAHNDAVLKFMAVKDESGNGSLTISGKNKDGVQISQSAIFFTRGNLILDGVTVRDASGGAANGGGAIRALCGTVDIDDCQFINNHHDSGGAISLYASDDAITCTIDDTVFEGNTATKYGGAIYIPNQKDVTCTIKNSTFGRKTTNGNETQYINGNTSASGGAIYIVKGNLDIIDCDFYGNVATKTSSITLGGGAICLNEYPNVSITGSGEFAGNSTNANGGAVYTNGGSISISGYDFVNNSGTAAGGALRLRAKYEGDTIRVENCDFLNNNSSNGPGGAIYLSGAPSGLSTDLILLGTGTFSGNTCKSGTSSTSYGSAIGLGAANTATTVGVHYGDNNTSYTFDNQTVQYNDKTDYTISVLPQ